MESISTPWRFRFGQADCLWPGSPQAKQRRTPVRACHVGSTEGFAGSVVVVIGDVGFIAGVVVSGVRRCWRAEFHYDKPDLFLSLLVSFIKSKRIKQI